MKKAFFISLWVLCSACTMYTVTNNSSRDLELKKAGGEKETLKKGECLELTEYFLGLAGDFPFIFVDEEEERSAGHYEVIDKPGSAFPDVNLSEKNVECDKSSDDEDKASTNSSDFSLAPGYIPMCLSGIKSTCQDTLAQAKCMKNSPSTEPQPVCVKEGKKIEGDPFCSSSIKAQNKIKCLTLQIIEYTEGDTNACQNFANFTCPDESKKVCSGGGATDATVYCVTFTNKYLWAGAQ